MARHSISIRLTAVVASLLVSLLAAELASRLTGHRPAKPDLDGDVQPWAAFDPELGWTNRPSGRVDTPWWSATFWPDASRPTRPKPETRARDLMLVLGCSYTQGYGVADADTFAWKLQQRFPQFDIRNFGTGGYGTYQSLLRFRRILKEGRIPKVVVFGFGDFHGVRDRATQSWMNQRGNARAFVPPHVDLVDDRLEELPGRVVPFSTISKWSGLWNWVEGEYTRQDNYAPDDDIRTREVHQAVLVKMRDEVERAGSRFLVADLWTMPSARADWQRFFLSQHFHVAECIGDGMPGVHPDVFWNLLHTDCIEHAIREDRFDAN